MVELESGLKSARWNRRILVHRVLLHKAKYGLPSSMKNPVGKDLFGADLVKAMHDSAHERAGEFATAGKTLGEISSGKPVT
jgi:hypothetical protein